MNIDRLASEIEQLYSHLLQAGGRLGGDELPSPTQRLALRIAVDEGPLRLGALADRMMTTDATATRTVDALESSGIVKRVADPEDRRGVLVTATSKGSRILTDRRRRTRELLERLLSDMPEEDVERLADLLAELNEHLHSQQLDASS